MNQGGKYIIYGQKYVVVARKILLISVNFTTQNGQITRGAFKLKHFGNKNYFDFPLDS